MKKRFLLVTCFLFLVLPLSAYSDSYSIYESNSDWNNLFRSIKENRGQSEVESIYSQYISSSLSNVEKARAEYNMVRYHIDNGNKAIAKEHFEKQKTAVNSLESDYTVLGEISRLDLISSDYYISGDIFTGMENAKKTKKLYEEYPEEIYIIINNAWRLIYTPQIAGGSNKNAIKILTPLLLEVSNMSEENRYSLYGALATACFNRHDYVEAKEYLEEALNIYYGEEALIELKEKLDKK